MSSAMPCTTCSCSPWMTACRPQNVLKPGGRAGAAAEAVTLDADRRAAGPPRGDRRGDAGRPAADDDDFVVAVDGRLPAGLSLRAAMAFEVSGSRLWAQCAEESCASHAATPRGRLGALSHGAHASRATLERHRRFARRARADRQVASAAAGLALCSLRPAAVRNQPSTRASSSAPRPAFLVADMRDGELKTRLEACLAQPPRRTASRSATAAPGIV